MPALLHLEKSAGNPEQPTTVSLGSTAGPRYRFEAAARGRSAIRKRAIMTPVSTRNERRRHMAGTLVVLVGLLMASSALALDKEDLLRLHEAGLDSGTIVNVALPTLAREFILPD